ncbi:MULTISPECIES: ABC transporter ATP-binding protein [Vibrio]|uniref:Hydrogenase expression protein n=3 Tax=Vibrio TaxID=662 RepID=A0A7Z1MM90_9VIBR|nr:MULTISPECIES: ABC transporter ATP-binding protein [Vibrio]MBE8557874.1 ABC transporter ATP-binding protein [Vibrio sp. OPT24]MBU2932902.1 ABC transporter ATP-binding protein [Vibrio cyclitrophicus]MDH5880442.1 ABC transporter ATP-binding protein [Vibrio sp. S/42/10]NOH21229.1 ABC transporter ATP-binding protein [Vibrio cyclitrophicus]NOH45474.1 ABC transporter ATP-binding protein [Vibrio cyclitrophicus]|tara:strand:+ start:527 stop:1291 length:765 start_codon:yes stop_codon:yes gene_type:complete
MSVNTIGVQLSNATLRYRDSEHATLSGLSLSLKAGKWTVLLGRSGCGKTTVLRYLAGLLDDKVEWQGTLATSDELPLTERIAYMAQQDLLLPWLSVIDNVCLSHRFQNSADKHKNIEHKNQALELLISVGLADYADAMPDQLSGGMRQRVALARTLMQDKPVVLMDEPFSALDAVTRHKLQSLACELLRGKTVVLITHDPQEAVRLADNLYVLQGTPASAHSLSVPHTSTPRVLDGECAELQQAILEQLERDYE